MGELVASIAHELNQPLATVVTNGSVCMPLAISCATRVTPEK
jgi:C4-dicarboxylate-specific signal transduction histidine kinase